MVEATVRPKSKEVGLINATKVLQLQQVAQELQHTTAKWQDFEISDINLNVAFML